MEQVSTCLLPVMLYSLVNTIDANSAGITNSVATVHHDGGRNQDLRVAVSRGSLSEVPRWSEQEIIPC